MQLNEIFINEFGRLRSGWRFAVFCSLFVVLYGITGVGLVITVQAIFGNTQSFMTGPTGLAVSSLVAFSVTTVLGWMCGKFLEDLPLKALGWVFNRTWLKDFLIGLTLGITAITIAVILAIPVGGISLVQNSAADSGAIARTFLSSFVVFFVAAAFEEVLFRGYILQTLIRAKLAWLGIFLTSIPFAFAHLGNPNVTLFSTINTALAGIWFGAAYLKTRSLWLAFGLHLAWNWFQGAFYGINVSGLSEIAPNPLFRAIDQGPTWLTGGHYGIEGGLTCMIALFVSTALIWFLPILKPTDDMWILTNQENPKNPDVT